MNKWTSISLITLIIMLTIFISHISAETEETLIVKVVNPLGEGLSRVEVLLVKGAETRRFITNASGYAEFKHVAPGEYTVKVVLESIDLAEEKVTVPEQREITLTAKIAYLKFILTNLEGDPLSGLTVNLSSDNLTFTAGSDKSGAVSFNQIPYSELEGVGEYHLTVTMENLIIHREELRITAPEISKTLSLPLLNIKLTIKDLEGNPVPRVTLTMNSLGYSTQKSSANGTITIYNLPSSRIDGVGVYKLNVTMRTRSGDLLIHSEERAFTSSEFIDLVTDLAKLTVKIVDEAGKPLSSIKVVLSNDLAKEFASVQTSVNGMATFEYIPLSFGKIRAGRYLMKAFRGDDLIGEMEFEVSKPRDYVELIAERKNILIRLTDFNGEPLVSYGVKVIDESTGEEFESITDSTGKASFKLFFGPYDLRVTKDGREVYTELLSIREELVDLNLVRVNFPLKIIVKDALGNPLKSAIIRISTEIGILKEVEASGEPIEVTLPYPTPLRCDIYSLSGRLLQRSKLLADSPGVVKISLSNYIEFNGLLCFESIALVVLVVMATISMASFFLVIHKRRKTKG